MLGHIESFCFKNLFYGQSVLFYENTIDMTGFDLKLMLMSTKYKMNVIIN